MNNHPNRGWRKRAENAADQWLDTPEAKTLAEVPEDPALAFSVWRQRLRLAWLAGFRDGRSTRWPIRR